MRNLLSQYWSQNPKGCPSFEENCWNLSNDFSCSEENVDEEEADEYIEKPEGVRKRNQTVHIQLKDELKNRKFN